MQLSRQVSGWVEVGVALLLTVLASCVGDPHGDRDSQAPCYDCEMYNLLDEDQSTALQPRQARQINSQCQYPCRCSNREHHCKAGVNMIKDGCDCCYMCARQQGDMCDYKDKCDEEKGLYCDFKMNGGVRGICRAKNAKACDVEGKTYKDGEEFKPDCRRLCTCQDGQYACSTLCPQEESRPSSVHCKHPRLIEISGKCCNEWTCPPASEHDEFTDEGVGTQRKLHLIFRSPTPPASSANGPRGGGTARVHDQGDTAVGRPGPDPVSPPCNKETTAWSACSQSCGMGVSVRVTNDNADCQPVQQRRLCLVRPCELNDKHLTGQHCKSTWKSKSIKLFNGDCESTEEYRPKFCSTCKKRKCCGPGRTKTVTIQFKCKDGRSTSEPMMWIGNCECHKDTCPWRSRRWLLGKHH